MAFSAPRNIAPSQARTTFGDTGALTALLCRNLNILANVTAVSGTTPSLALSLEWWDEALAAWAVADPPDAFTAITATSAIIKKFEVKTVTYRVRWAITGTTPSFTFDLQVYET